MSAAPNGHGEWPTEFRRDLEREPPEKPEIPLNASPMQLARILGSLIIAWHPVWRAMLGALEFLRGMLIGAKGSAESAATLAREARDEARGAHAVALAIAEKLGVKLTTSVGTPPLPPMRERAESLVEFAEEVKQATLIGERRPDTTADEQVDRLLEAKLAARAERERIKKLEDEAAARKAADDARRDRRKAIAKWAAGILSAVASGWLLRELTSIHWH